MTPDELLTSCPPQFDSDVSMNCAHAGGRGYSMLASANFDTHVGPWPDRPPWVLRQPGCIGPDVVNAFPSGRSAILACLELGGIDTQSVVATPECVTACVADAVRSRARTVPIRMAVEGSARPAAAIVYEQWGWPLPAQAADEVSQRLDGVSIIVDRVDSADFFSAPRNLGAFEVLSLSKVLGLDAGGIARRSADRALLRFAPTPSSGRFPSAGHPGLISHPAVRELFKQSQFVHPGSSRWLAHNCAVAALDLERQERSAAASLILGSPLCAAWPAWMTEAIASGAGPVWAPVLRGRNPAVHTRAIAALEHGLGVRAAVRMFNWSGNPLSPRFEPSVAVPIHSGLRCVAEAVSLLSATSGRRSGP